MTSSKVTDTLSEILSIIALAAGAAQPLLVAVGPEAVKIDALAEALAKIAQKAVAAYGGVTGQPIDLSLLQPIEPIE
jgi:hypothetical protein